MEPLVERLGFWFFIVLITLICVFGILGNILSLIVLVGKRMRSSTSIILVGLVISDIIILGSGLIINSIGMVMIRVYFQGSKTIPTFAVIVFRIFHPLKKIGEFECIPNAISQNYRFNIDSIIATVTGNLASVYITILVTVERYIAVCWPFHAKTMFTVKTSIWWTYGIIAGSVI